MTLGSKCEISVRWISRLCLEERKTPRKTHTALSGRIKWICWVLIGYYFAIQIEFVFDTDEMFIIHYPAQSRRHPRGVVLLWRRRRRSDVNAFLISWVRKHLAVKIFSLQAEAEKKQEQEGQGMSMNLLGCRWKREQLVCAFSLRGLFSFLRRIKTSLGD